MTRSTQQKMDDIMAGVNLDTYVNDTDWLVRLMVAYQDYGLDVLVNDREDFVRLAVALRGYGLETLVNDQDSQVRTTAEAMLRSKTI